MLGLVRQLLGVLGLSEGSWGLFGGVEHFQHKLIRDLLFRFYSVRCPSDALSVKLAGKMTIHTAESRADGRSFELVE